MDIDNIRFTAINSGLGLKSPKSKSPAVPTEDVIQKVSFTTFQREIARPKVSGIQEYWLIENLIKSTCAEILDTLFISLFFTLLCLMASWQLGTWILNANVFLGYGLLWVAIYSFYFSFFKHFKLPSPGKMMIFK